MVTLKALEAALTQIEHLRDHEFTFEAGDMAITLRPLRSSEETEVQRYAQVAWEGVGEKGDTAAYQDFLDRVRVSTLGFSIVQLGDTDLRDAEYVETGETDESGNPVSVLKWQAIRDLISSQWTKALTLQVFAKFGELLERIDIKASKLVKFDPADLDEEIDRLEKRLNDLKLKRDERKAPDTTPTQKAQKAAVDVARHEENVRQTMRSNLGPTAQAQRQQDVENMAERPPEPEVAPESRPASQRQEAVEAPQRRQSAVPETAPPPERQNFSETQEMEQEPSEQPTEAPVVDEQGIELPYDGDTFFDPTDPAAAMAAEGRRQAMLHARNLQRAREKKMAAQRSETLGTPTSADLAKERLRAQQERAHPPAVSLGHDPRTAGLRQAANLQDQMVDSGAGRVQTARPQQPPSQRQSPTQLHGRPVYKMPAQTLDRPQNTRSSDEPPVPINPTPGGRQSKFRGPGEQ